MQNITKSAADGGLRALLRADWKWFLAMTLAAFALRLFFILRVPNITPDSFVYGDLAKNWLLHHVYGLTANGGPAPTYIRLPGYPAFLAVLWSIFGMEHYGAARFVQLFVDVAACFVTADLARRIAMAGGISSACVARWAVALTALCPFLANYTAVPLTETLSIFLSALALDFAVAALGHQDRGPLEAPHLRVMGWQDVAGRLAAGSWAGCGLAIAAGLYLRPDGGFLLIAIGGFLLYRLACKPDKARTFCAGVVLGACALAPLAPWTLRNWGVFHHFIPLAPTHADDPGEFLARGFDRWMHTWLVDYASMEDVAFRLDSDPIPIEMLPNRAFDTPEERSKIEELLEQYNDNIEITPALDAQFADLARERIRRQPFRYYVELPVLRALDLWFRPRTEMLPLDPHWWRFRDDPREFAWSLLLALINLVYVALAVFGLRRWREFPFLGMLVGFTVVRTVLITVLTYPEPRYVLECYPVVIVFAAAACASRHSSVLSLQSSVFSLRPIRMWPED
jgi:hypothetical protein